MAVPTGIISAGFVEKYSRSEHSDKRYHDIHELGEILCSKESEFIGLTVDEIEEKYGIRTYMIIRSDLTVVPNEHIRIAENDILIVKTDKLIKKKKKKKSSR